MALCRVKEIAEECGVTPQGVNKFLRSSGLQAQCIKDGNRFLIPENVQELLKTHFLEKETNSETEKLETEPQKPETETVSDAFRASSVPWEVYQDLRRQLEIKDSQIADLSKALVASQESLKAAQVLHGADKREVLLEAAKEEPAPAGSEEAPPKSDAWKSKSLFDRIFKR
uniref:DUF536 domain-containing protein n=1 Tax=uncultured prokaryote TaxID=198431 RepID=A0A0H5PX97_9ZZZZ|nr:hypothetical protein [uncultured prokaryote]